MAQHAHTLPQTKQRTKVPSFYKVLMHNDDITPRGFVVVVLRQFFAKSEPEANRIMLQVHNDGIGVVAVYSFEIAEAKSMQAIQYAREEGYPLNFSIEKE